MRPGAAMVQWLQAYEIDDPLMADVLCTLRAAFAHVAVFRMAPNDLALVASDRPLRVDLAAAGQAMAGAQVQAELAGHGDDRLPRTLDEFLLLQLSGSATMNRLCAGHSGALSERFPTLEYRAPRAFFVGSSARRIRAVLDTRTRPAPDTELARTLGGGPLTLARKRALHGFLVRSNYRNELPLRLASAPTFEDLPQGMQTLAAGLPEPASADVKQARQACQLLVQRGAIERAQTLFGALPIGPRLGQWQRACQAVVERPRGR
jgi:hypothetical protein